jgi:DNA-binding transcriptional regulator/RsmH inhibitor MraZ
MREYETPPALVTREKLKLIVCPTNPDVMDNKIMVVTCDKRLWKERLIVTRRKLWSMINNTLKTMKMNTNQQQWCQTVLQAKNDE